MVSRNYTVQSEKGITLNAKSPNNGSQYNAKPAHNPAPKTKQNIHYKQSVGTQYCSTHTTQNSYPSKKPVGIPTYTPIVDHDLNLDLKSVKSIVEPVSNFTFVPITKEIPIYSESTNKLRNTENAYAKNVSTFSTNGDTYSVKSFKIRSSTPNITGNGNNNANLPTIAESIVEDGEYPVDVEINNVRRYDFKGSRNAENDESFENRREPCCREHANHRSNRLQYFTDHPLELGDTKERSNCKYQGSHPDSLCRVPVGNTPWSRHSAASRLRGPCRVLRWPLALAAICISLALLVYFLMPEINPPMLVYDNVNSTEWVQGEEQLFRHETSNLPETRMKESSFLDNNSVEKRKGKTSGDSSDRTTDDKVLLHFGYIDGDSNDGVDKFIELLPPSSSEKSFDVVDSIKNSQTTPSPPVFPTNVSPSVQYGNEYQDGGSNEKRTPKKPSLSRHPVTDIYDDKFLTQTFAIFYNREALSTTESGEKSEEVERVEQNPAFTSGHQNSFGIPIEEAEKMKSTTQAAIYNTKVSPTLPSMTGNNKIRSTTVRSRWNTTEDGMCHSTRLSMCRGVLPYDLTTLPLVAGINTFQELDAAVPYFDYILRSGCSPRARQFICSLLEPECKPRGMKILPPCRRACKAIAESCQEVIAGSLELSQIFNCQQYPEQESECITLARGAHCLTGELRCPLDGSCVPLHWRCDNISDCPGGTDELQCDDQSCAPAEFRCGGRGSCIPEEWVCDGHQDCPGADDEAACGSTGDGDVVSAASYHPRPARVLRPKLRPQPLPGSSIYTAAAKSTGEYENSKELLMMSDSVMPMIKPISSLTTRKKIYTSPTTPRIHQITSSSSSISISQSSPCPKYDPNCKRTKYGLRTFNCPSGMNCTDNKKNENATSTSTTNRSTTVTSTTESITTYHNRGEDSHSSGTSHSSPCPLGELRCVDGRCITFSQLCDNHTDCTDGADEANCFA